VKREELQSEEVVKSVCVQIEPSHSEEIVKAENLESKSDQGECKSVHVQIEPDSAAEQDPSGLISIRVEGPSTSPHEFTPVESPCLPVLALTGVDTGKAGEETEPITGDASIVVVKEQSEIPSVESQEENLVTGSLKVNENQVDDSELAGVDAVTSELTSGATLVKTEPETSDRTKSLISPVIQASVAADPLVAGVKTEAEENTSTKGVNGGDELAFGEEDTISAIIELYEKTLDLRTGEKVDEKVISPGSGICLPQITSTKDSPQSPLRKSPDHEDEALLSLNTKQGESTDKAEESLPPIQPTEQSLQSPQVSSPDKDNQETDMTVGHIRLLFQYLF
jgi:hypothetical protein